VITDGILYVVGTIVSFVGGLLPTATLTGLPAAITDFGETLGTKAGPLNQFFPVEELFTGLVIMLVYWLPAVLLYQVVFWVYKHLPVVGKG